MSERFEWVEEYAVCGCLMLARLRRELPGYCATHGNSWRVRYKQERSSGRIVSRYRTLPEPEAPINDA